MMLAAFVVSLQFGTMTLPLREAPVPTLIEEKPVTVLVSGDADLAFDGEGAIVSANLALDLSDIQGKFSSIVRERTSNVGCEERLIITAASLRRTRSAVEIAATAIAESWRCENGGAKERLSEERGSVRFRVDVQRTSDAWVAFTLQPMQLTGSQRLRELIAQQLAGAEFGEAARHALAMPLTPALLVAPLPENARTLRPDIETIRFRDTTDGAVVIEVQAKMHVPSEKLPILLFWALGD